MKSLLVLITLLCSVSMVLAGWPEDVIFPGMSEWRERYVPPDDVSPGHFTRCWHVFEVKKNGEVRYIGVRCAPDHVDPKEEK